MVLPYFEPGQKIPSMHGYVEISEPLAIAGFRGMAPQRREKCNQISINLWDTTTVVSYCNFSTHLY